MTRRPVSLALRLSVLVAGVALLVFAGVGLYLYQSLATQLEERDAAELSGRLSLIRHLLDESANVAAIVDDPHRLIDSTGFNGELLLDVRTEQGQAVIGNAVGPALGNQLPLIPVDHTPTPNDMHTIRPVSGLPLMVVAAWGKTGDGSLVRIRLSRPVAAREALLTAYRVRVYTAIVAGSAMTAVIGYLFIWLGLGTVRSLARQAEKVTATQLQLRLDASSAPAELREVASAFNEVLDRLQHSFEQLSQFAADLAHDMRTPLNNLMVQTQVMLSQPRSIEEYQNLLSSNHEEFERLSRTVESMLFLARADHNEIALAIERLDLAAELGRLAEYFDGPAADAELSFIVSADGHVLADASLFRRALGNLVSNALRYTPPRHSIILATEENEDGVIVKVTNPGVGITEEHLPRLFDRFYRADTARPSTSASAGLGLAIVKSIMSLHNGRASVTSAPRKETTFALFFPHRTAGPGSADNNMIPGAGKL